MTQGQRFVLAFLAGVGLGAIGVLPSLDANEGWIAWTLVALAVATIVALVVHWGMRWEDILHRLFTSRPHTRYLGWGDHMREEPEAPAEEVTGSGNEGGPPEIPHYLQLAAVVGGLLTGVISAVAAVLGLFTDGG